MSNPNDPPATTRCPCCGGTLRAVGRYGVCEPCAATLGWDPPCAACWRESRGIALTYTKHERTCGRAPLTLHD